MHDRIPQREDGIRRSRFSRWTAKAVTIADEAEDSRFMPTADLVMAEASHNRRYRSQVLSTILLVVAMVATLTTASVPSIAAQSAGQVPATSGALDAREFNIDGCGFRNNNEIGACTLPAGQFYPSAPNVNSIVSGGVCSPFGAVNNSSISSSGTPNDCLYENGVAYPADATTSPNGLLGDIFSGTDAFGHPDLPTGNYNFTNPTPTSSSVTCTTNAFVAQDAGGSNVPCGNQSTSAEAADWAIIEGWVVLPPTPTGLITLRVSNVGADATPRENYVAMMVSPDDNPANLQFVGESQTQFRVEAQVDLTTRTTTVGSATDALTCDSPIQYVRLYYFDNYVGGSASVTWSLDGGTSFSSIPTENLSNTNPRCSPEATPDQSLNNPIGTQVQVDVLANDPGAVPLDPTTVMIIDPATGLPVTSLVVPGEGEWVVDPVTGAITFIPEPGFTGNPTPVDYVVSDFDGTVAEPVSVTVTYLPEAQDDESLGNPPGPVTLDILGNDSDNLDPNSVALIDPATGLALAPGAPLVVPGEGTWTFDPATGEMTFTPEPGFTGNPTPVDYEVSDLDGNTVEATVTIGTVVFCV